MFGFGKKKGTKKRKTASRSKTLKANTKRVAGRVVPVKGYKFAKGGGGRVVKVK